MHTAWRKGRCEQGAREIHLKRKETAEVCVVRMCMMCERVRIDEGCTEPHGECWAAVMRVRVRVRLSAKAKQSVSLQMEDNEQQCFVGGDREGVLDRVLLLVRE